VWRWLQEPEATRSYHFTRSGGGWSYRTEERTATGSGSSSGGWDPSDPHRELAPVRRWLPAELFPEAKPGKKEDAQ
jgi:hypothetical protein